MSTIHNAVAFIVLDSPSLASLGPALSERIPQQIKAALAGPSVRGIVLTGADMAFSAGAEVTESNMALQFQAATLRCALDEVEASRNPVVAALAGVTLGGGLDLALALACHGRVALESALAELPEVTLGLIPGSGGTQRLARLIGQGAALLLILSGQSHPVRRRFVIGVCGRPWRHAH